MQTPPVVIALSKLLGVVEGQLDAAKTGAAVDMARLRRVTDDLAVIVRSQSEFINSLQCETCPEA